MAQLSAGFSKGASITGGLTELKDIKRFTKRKSFVSRHHKKFDKLTPFFGTLLNIFSLFGVMGNSGELQRIENLMKVINKGFERLETKMEHIKNRLDSLDDEVKRQHFWTRIDPDLKKLYQAEARIKLYYNTTDDGLKTERLKYFNEKEYNDMYDAYISIKGTFEGKVGRYAICDTLIEVTNTDLERVLHVLYDLYIGVIQAAKDLVRTRAIMGDFKGKDDLKNEYIEELAMTLTSIKESIDNCEEDIRGKRWKLQWRSEVENYLKQSDSKSTSKFSNYSLNTSIWRKMINPILLGGGGNFYTQYLFK